MISGRPHLIATTSELFIQEATGELQAALGEDHLGGTVQVEAGTSGLLLVTLPEPERREAYLAGLRAKRSIFVRHVHAVDLALRAADLPLDELEILVRNNAPTLAHRVALPSGSEPEASQAPIVQVRRVASRACASGGQIAAWLQGVHGEVSSSFADRAPIVSCTAYGDWLYLGLGDAVQNLAPRMGGVLHYDMSLFPVSRAGAKLAEAFEVFQVETPRGGRAIDLGAAPGGWTAVLVEHGYHVDAIDPGEMHVTLLAHPQVRPLRIKAQDFRPKTAGYNLLTCDVNWDAKETAGTVRALARYLAPAASAIVTIKLQAGNAMPQIHAVCAILDAAWTVEAVKLLFHNRREVTLHLKRR